MNSSRKWEFFVSYVPADRDMARWVVSVLHHSGHDVTPLDYGQAGAAVSFTEAVQQSSRIIPIVSPAIAMTYEEREWRKACATDPGGLNRYVIPVKVRPYAHPSWLPTLIDLSGLSNERQAAELLLNEIGASLRGRRTFWNPPFPGPS